MKIRAALVAVGVSALVLSGCATPAASGQTTSPQSCLDALDLADQGFGIAQQMFIAINNQDLAALNASTQQLKAITPAYQTAKAACRAGTQ
jgi:hypothetical protein